MLAAVNARLEKAIIAGRRVPIRVNRMAITMTFLLLAGAICFQKLNFPVGDSAIHFPTVIVFAMIGLGVVTGYLRPTQTNTLRVTILFTAILLTQLINAGGVMSVSSLALLLVVHIPYVFAFRKNTIAPITALGLFQNLMTVFAILGVVQFCAQFVVGTDLAFIWDSIIPPGIYRDTMHNLNAISYRSRYYKSTGVFFSEPAVFCQYLAIATIIEIIYFRRALRVAIFASAIAVTFSGTGLIIVFALLPFYLIEKRHFVILVLGCSVVLSFPFWASDAGLGVTADRLNSLSSSETSGYLRLVLPFLTVYNYSFNSADTFFFGYGAGSTRIYAGLAGDVASTATWSKLVFEYGFVGFLAYITFFVTMLKSATGSIYLKAAIFIQYFFLGEYLLSSDVQPLILSLLLWPALTSMNGEVRPRQPSSASRQVHSLRPHQFPSRRSGELTRRG